MTINLRRAQRVDCKQLFEWVNSPDSLAAKLLTTEPVSWHDHESWFATKVSDPDVAMWIVEYRGGPVGQVRFSLRDSAYDVDVFIDSSHRRSGMAAEVLIQAIEEFRSERGSEIIFRALIKNDNRMSKRLFEKLEFQMTERTTDFMTYIL